MLHEVVTSRDQTLRKPFENDRERRANNGFALITGDEKKGSNNEMVEFEVQSTFRNTDGYKAFCKKSIACPQTEASSLFSLMASTQTRWCSCQPNARLFYLVESAF